MVSHLLDLLVVIGVKAAAMDGQGSGCGDVGQTPDIDLAPVNCRIGDA